MPMGHGTASSATCSRSLAGDMPGRESERSGRLLYICLTVTLSAAAILVAWLLTRNVPGALGYLEPVPAPVTVVVQDQMVDHGSTATLSLTYGDPADLLGTGADGIVTRLELRPGDAIGAGQILYDVDNVPVRAYLSDIVFYRLLRAGDAGDDVAAAQEILNSLDPAAMLEVDGRYGADTQRAVSNYERSLGLGRGSGVFDPSWFVRVPPSGFTVAEVEIGPGEPAPGRGERFATGVPELVSAKISVASNAPDGVYEFVSEGRRVPVVRSGGEWVVDPEEIGTVLPGPKAPSDSLDQAQVEGIVRLATGLPAQAVPPASLIEATTPLACVAVISGAEIALHSVELLGSDASGSVLISPALPEDAQVLVNPHAMGYQSCP